MAHSDQGEGATRDDLLQRVALMETMIAEGRRTTTRYGWMFLMWGLLYFVGMGWTMLLPMPNLAWPVCISVGIAVVVVKSWQKRAGASENLRSRSVEAVWEGMGIAAVLFTVGGVLSGHGGQPIFIAAILFMVGMAHGISALILRWGMQGVAAAVWGGCGVAACFATTSNEMVALFLTASFFGMVLFGLYAMVLERRHSAAPVQHHA